MSRERATAAPTGLKIYSNSTTIFLLARSQERERTYVTSAAPTGLKSIFIIPYWF